MTVGDRKRGAWAAMARAEVARDGGTVYRPLAGGRTLPLAWVRGRAGRDAAPGRTPVLMIPGGPGLASVLPYRGPRRRAVRAGLDTIMVEHRGIGLSRTDDTGADLHPGEVTTTAVADDLAAALDAAGVERALVYGTSYGSYLAQVFGARHPGRVAAMVLDSPCLDPVDDVEAVRAHLRSRFWVGEHLSTERAAGLVRSLSAAGEDPLALTEVVTHTYEFAGAVPLERLLAARRRGRAGHAWRRIRGLGRAEIAGEGSPMVFEPDLVRAIGQVELGYATPPDGHVLDLQRIYAHAPRVEDPHTPPYDLAAALPGFGWPTAVVSGERDLRTPRPVAERIVAALPDGVLVGIGELGHSALDTHPDAALTVARLLGAGGTAALADVGESLTTSPRRGAPALLGPLLTAGIGLETMPFLR